MGAPDHHCRSGAEETSGHQIAIPIVSPRWPPEYTGIIRRTSYQIPATGSQLMFWFGAHVGKLNFQFIGHPFIVGIEECDKFSSCLSYTLVTCIRRPAALGGSNKPYSAVLEPGELAIEIVAGTVVDNDQLQFPGRLIKYAPYGAENCPRAVIDGDYHGNVGRQLTRPDPLVARPDLRIQKYHSISNINGAL